jgi:hypothetical protein
MISIPIASEQNSWFTSVLTNQQWTYWEVLLLVEWLHFGLTFYEPHNASVADGNILLLYLRSVFCDAHHIFIPSENGFNDRSWLET